MAAMKIQDERTFKTEQESFCKKLLQHILEIYFELLKDRDISQNFAMGIITITSLQLIGYAYSNAEFDNNTLSIFFHYLRIYPILEEIHSKTLYWILQYLFFTLILVYILFMVQIAYSIHHKKHNIKLPTNILRNLSCFFLWILALPIVEMFASVFTCSNGYHLIDSSLKCWKGVHIFYCVFFILGILLFSTIGFAIAVLYKESSPSSKDGLAWINSDLEIYLFLYRVFIAIITRTLFSVTYDWLLMIIHVIGSLYFLVAYLNYLPYFNHWVSITFGAGICSYFWSALNTAFFSYIYSTNEMSNMLLCIGILLGVILMRNAHRRRIRDVIFGYSNKKFTKEHKLLIYLHEMLRITNKKSKNETDRLILMSLAANRNEKLPTKEKTSRIKNDLIKKAVLEDKAITLDDELIINALKDKYDYYLRISNFKAALHLSYSNFLFNSAGNIHMAIVEVRIAEKMAANFQQMFSIYRCKKQMETILIEKFNRKPEDGSERLPVYNLDVTVVVEFEKLYQNLLKSMEVSTNKYSEFWEQLNGILPDLNTLHKIGLDITKYNKKVDDVWKKLIKINSNYYKALRNYGSYVRDIRNDEEIGTELIERGNMYYKYINDDLDDFNMMFADDTVIIIMSAGSKETQGKIVSANSGVTNLFKYNPMELVGQDVGMLMPAVLAANHNDFLDRYFKTGKGRVMNNETELYAMSRSRTLFCISLIVKLIPNLKDDIYYIGLIRQQNKGDNYILTDKYGKIYCASEQFSGSFQLYYDFLKENEVFIQFLSQELLYSDEREPFNSLSEYTNLTFILYKDFHALVRECNKRIGSSHKDTNTEMDEELKSPGRNTKISGFNSETLKEVGKLKEGMYCKDNIRAMRRILNSKKSNISMLKKETYIVESKKLEFPKDRLELRIFRIASKKSDNREFSEKLFSIKGNREPTGPTNYGCDSVNVVPENSGNLLAVRRTPLQKVNSPEEENSREKMTCINLLNVPSKKVDSHTLINRAYPAMDSEDCQGLPAESFHDNSISLNISQVETVPLISAVGTRISAIKNVAVLQKSNIVSDDQKELVQNLMKATSEFGYSGNETKKEENSKEEKKIEAKTLNDEVGSVASRTRSLIKQIKLLRSSVYDKYCPGSVRHLTTVARVCFLVLLGLALAYYFVGKYPYSTLRESSSNMISSRDRDLSIILLGGATRILILLNTKDEYGQPIVKRTKETYHMDGFMGNVIEGYNKMNYEQWAYYCIDQSAKLLKLSQNEISTSSIIFNRKYMNMINPNEIMVKHKEENQLTREFSMDCWSAITSLAIYGLKIKEIPLSEITPENPSIYYILANSFNNILKDIFYSTVSIRNEARDTVSHNKLTLLILMIVASLCVVISLILILRVIVNTTRNKEAILKLFIDIPLGDTKELCNKCRLFLTSIHAADKGDSRERELEIDDNIKHDTSCDEEKKDEVEDLYDREEIQKTTKHIKKSSKKRFKPYSTNILSIMLHFIFFIILLEGYFLSVYLQSFYFLSNILKLFDTIEVTISEQAYIIFLYWSFQELVASESKGEILSENSEQYVIGFVNGVLKEHERFLTTHSNYGKSFSQHYNSKYLDLIYGDTCKNLHLNKELYKDCQKYDILPKGIHTATISIWDNIRELLDLYAITDDKDLKLMKTILDNKQIHEIREMINTYYFRVYNELISILNDDVKSRLDNEYVFVLAMFIIFIAVTFGIYFIPWNLFMQRIKNSLWVTKCMLAIIPVHVMLKVQNIKNFLIYSSKGLMKNLE